MKIRLTKHCLAGAWAELGKIDLLIEKSLLSSVCRSTLVELKTIFKFLKRRPPWKTTLMEDDNLLEMSKIWVLTVVGLQ